MGHEKWSPSWDSNPQPLGHEFSALDLGALLSKTFLNFLEKNLFSQIMH